MKRIILINLFALLVFQNVVHAQALTCTEPILPYCPGDPNYDNGFFRQILMSGQSNGSSTSSCDSVQIITQPQHGTVECVGTGGNVQGKYLYIPSSTCFDEDSFVVQNIFDTTLDTVHYLHLTFQCETPDDIFCCISPNGPDVILDVLQNDNEFINTNYPGATILVDSISGISDDRVIVRPDYTIQYSPPFNEEIDSFSYEVFLEIITSDGDTITICDEQTCYIQIDNCLNTIPDGACIQRNDTVCIDPIANDMVAIIFDDPVLDSIGCTNPEPMIDPTTLTAPLPIDGGTMPWEDGNGNWCFTHKSVGTYTYTYDICTDTGGCATDSIVITVNDGVSCPCNSTLSINNTYNNGDNEYIEVTESIFSTATINDGADVTFDAGNFILLEDVFLADKGAVFLAKIDGCDDPEIEIKGSESGIISVFKNYPNPFTGQTTIEFTITKDAPVTLLVFDALGRKVATLLDTAPTPTGIHQVTFEGTGHSPGVYYYTIRAGEFSGTQKMILVK